MSLYTDQNNKACDVMLSDACKLGNYWILFAANKWQLGQKILKLHYTILLKHFRWEIGDPGIKSWYVVDQHGLVLTVWSEFFEIWVWVSLLRFLQKANQCCEMSDTWLFKWGLITVFCQMLCQTCPIVS